MGKFFDFILNKTRWLVAIFLLFMLPGMILSFEHFNFKAWHFYMLGVGIAFFGFTFLFAGYNVRQSMQVAAHELTHLLFAFLTFNSGGRIRVNPDGSGGSMRTKGNNWLIILSPYFFPLFAFFYMLIMPFLVDLCKDNWILYAILGYFLAYYWETVVSQVHPQQTDIICSGYFFSAIIIITGNILMTGIILAFTSQLWGGVLKYLRIIWSSNQQFWLQIVDLIANYI